MKENTLNKIEHIHKKMHSASRSDAVREAIEIAETIIKATEKGEKIIIEDKRGNKTRILLRGI